MKYVCHKEMHFLFVWMPTAKRSKIQKLFCILEKNFNSKPVQIKLYYYNKLKDPNRTFDPKYVLPVKRAIPRTKTPVQDAIKLLIRGDLAWAERSAGFTTEFPHSKFKLKSAKLKNGVLTLTFPDIPGFTTGGAARVGLLAQSIRKTARQFPQVRQVIFEPEYLFQP